MINKEEYIAVFSQVTASADTHREVENMVNTQKRQPRAGLRRAIVLAAAVVMLMALTVTAFAAEDIANWFRSYFEGRMDGQLSEAQITLLEENEQPLGQSITHDGWTIELVSAIHDDAAGYVVFRITVPEEVDGSSNWVFGNFSLYGQENQRDDRFLTASSGVFLSGWGTSWEYYEGNDNVRDFVVRLTANREWSEIDPFGPDAKYYFNIENIARDRKDENGQVVSEILAEGTWEFTICFGDAEKSGCETVELLREPVTTKAIILRSAMDGPEEIEAEVALTSVMMRHLSVTFYHEGCEGAPDFTMGWFENPESKKMEEAMPAVVMKDGTEIMLLCNGASDLGSTTVEAESPIVFEEVSHIRMADGTVIPMPEME